MVRKLVMVVSAMLLMAACAQIEDTSGRGEVTGNVETVDEENRTIVVGGETFVAPPGVDINFAPGERVRVHYVTVDGIRVLSAAGR